MHNQIGSKYEFFTSVSFTSREEGREPTPPDRSQPQFQPHPHKERRSLPLPKGCSVTPTPHRAFGGSPIPKRGVQPLQHPPAAHRAPAAGRGASPQPRSSNPSLNPRSRLSAARACLLIRPGRDKAAAASALSAARPAALRPKAEGSSTPKHPPNTSPSNPWGFKLPSRSPVLVVP